MGYGIAQAAAARGHRVRLVAGPVHLAPPAGVRVIPVVSAQDMLRAVRRQLAWSDALVMAAAVADWKPKRYSAKKLKKGRAAASLELVRTPDVLGEIAPLKGGRVFVGFAAETGNLLREARRKLKEKRLDLIVANDVTEPGAGFDVDTNRVTLIDAEGHVAALPLMSKRAVGTRIVRWIEERHGR